MIGEIRILNHKFDMTFHAICEQPDSWRGTSPGWAGIGLYTSKMLVTEIATLLGSEVCDIIEVRPPKARMELRLRLDRLNNCWYMDANTSQELYLGPVDYLPRIINYVESSPNGINDG